MDKSVKKKRYSKQLMHKIKIKNILIEDFSLYEIQDIYNLTSTLRIVGK